MSQVTIWLHCVWSTKNRKIIIPHKYRPQILNHLRDYAKQHDIFMDYVNLHKDHVHLLLNLGKTQNVAAILQRIKGESSFWLNKMKFFSYQFQWQDDYFAVSVSPSHVEGVRRYIARQDEHHKKMTREEEMNWFLEECGFEREKDGG